MSGPNQPNARKVVLAAMLSNLGIAVAKLGVAVVSGSVSLLAEAAHSLVDTANQALLLVGMVLSRRVDPRRYPLGRAKESYFWAFVVALLLFFLGGIFGIYEGVHKLRGGSEQPGAPLLPLLVIAVSFAFEGTSFVLAWREFSKQRGPRSLDEAIFQGKDPTIPVVLLEDSAAMLGLSVAFAAVIASTLTHSNTPDAVGSIVIGTLLCLVGIALARDTRSLLIGEGVTAEVAHRTLELVLETEGVEAVTQMLSYHLGPDTVLLALKIRFAPHTPVEEVERITDQLEGRVRTELPIMKRIFVEADGDYDAKLDPEGAAGGPEL
jgi:cation diffusion facilitator family transporter